MQRTPLSLHRNRSGGGAQPPDPYRTPGLERGGGVTPGDTPPDSARAPAGPKDPPIPSRAIGPVVLVVIAVMTLLVVGFVVAEVMNWATLF